MNVLADAALRASELRACPAACWAASQPLMTAMSSPASSVMPSWLARPSSDLMSPRYARTVCAERPRSAVRCRSNAASGWARASGSGCSIIPVSAICPADTVPARGNGYLVAR